MLRRLPLVGTATARPFPKAPSIHFYFGGLMQAILKTLLAGALLALSATIVIGAPPTPDPAIGTWKLNLAKSTYSPGPGPKSQIRTYAETPQGVQLTLRTTAADGKETTATLTFSYDGKPYAVTGNPDFDTVAVTRSDGTTHSTQTRAGATVGTGVRTVSKDGKTLTFAQKGTRASGTAYDDVAVYDRQ